MRLLFFFLIAVCFSLNPVQAQADSALSDKIRGNWASADCNRYSEALVLTGWFYLKSSKKEMTLLPAYQAGKRDDHWILVVGGENRPVRLEEDGILKIATGKTGKVWDDEKLTNRMEYTGCTEAPTVVPKMMSRLMRYIDRIKDECTVKLDNDCSRVLFKMTDANSDKKITPSEIKRTVATSLLFAELSQKKTVTTAEADKLAKESKAEGQKISDALMAAHDKDKSGSLDYNELFEKFTAPNLPIVKATLIKAGNLLPAFKMAAMGLD